MLDYTKQAINKGNILSKTNIQINTKQEIQELRIIVKSFGYIIEIVYNVQEESEENKDEKVIKKKIENDNHLNIDLGVNNLATLTSNLRLRPILVNGKIVKSINQYSNKLLSILKSTKKRNKVLEKRYFRLEYQFHKIANYIVNYAYKNNISKIIIGNNDNWKQESSLGKVNNQNFQYIPFKNLIDKITYKAKLLGITVIPTEEAYTSKANFFAKDPLPKFDEPKPKFSGKKKGNLYITDDGFAVHKDVIGSLNIGRKVNPEFDIRARSVVATPVRVTIS
jgi:putative transposase